MTNTRGLGAMTEAIAPIPVVSPPSLLSGRRRTRIALLAGATVILLLGAAAAGVFGYLTIVRGTPVTATTGAPPR